MDNSESMEWLDINEFQPTAYQTVIWACAGGRKEISMYYGKDHCDSLPEGHPMKNKPREVYGKFGRYAEPAANGYRVLYWMPCEVLPELPDEH
jgi:hypothetical protein